jgi:hypothetical protein
MLEVTKIKGRQIIANLIISSATTYLLFHCRIFERRKCMVTKHDNKISILILVGLVIFGFCGYPERVLSKDGTPSKKEMRSDDRESLYVEKEISMGIFGMQKIRTHKRTGKTEVYDGNKKWSPITITPEGKITIPKGTQLLIHSAPIQEEVVPAKAEEMQSHAKVKKVTGNVTKVDTKSNTITVKGKKGDVTVAIATKTKILMGKDLKVLADVKVGDKITVKYTETDGEMTAKRVAIMTAD